jgi:hypothetical protein
MKRQRRVIFVDVLDDDLPWDLRRAALDRRTTLRRLVNQILVEWLQANGYRRPTGCGAFEPDDPAARE